MERSERVTHGPTTHPASRISHPARSRIPISEMTTFGPCPRRRDPSGLRPHYIRERSWPVAGRFALCLPAQRLEDLLGGDRYFIDAHAHGVVNGVRDRRWHGEERPLAALLRPERAVRV